MFEEAAAGRTTESFLSIIKPCGCRRLEEVLDWLPGGLAPPLCGRVPPDASRASARVGNHNADSFLSGL